MKILPSDPAAAAILRGVLIKCRRYFIEAGIFKYNDVWEDYFYEKGGIFTFDEWYINVKENYINEWIEYRINGGSNKYGVYEAAMMRDRQINSILED